MTAKMGLHSMSAVQIATHCIIEMKFPFHPGTHFREPCGTLLMKNVKSPSGKRILYPRLIYLEVFGRNVTVNLIDSLQTNTEIAKPNLKGKSSRESTALDIPVYFSFRILMPHACVLLTLCIIYYWVQLNVL